MSPADINEEVAPSGHPEVGGVPNVLPVLPLRDNVVLPQTVLPILVGRSRSRELVQWMVDHEHDTLVLTGTQSDHDEPGPADVSPTGVLARIIQMSRFGDRTYRLVVEGIQRVRLHGFVQTEPYLAAEIELLEERQTDGTRVEALPPRCSRCFDPSKTWRPTSHHRRATPRLTLSRPAGSLMRWPPR